MRTEYRFFVYIMSNVTRSVLYTGVTNNLVSRVGQHRRGESEFTRRHKCKDLMYYEEYNDIDVAIHREKQLKRWRRQWKFELIRKVNPLMKDLYGDLFESGL
ncbi:GIY-YIG nuclease family protein [Terrimonas sp. NA20]|uniref:GIY-YIG nuclease family protein n=1 Tax=Terrimonas ginsenosidimutans TaxID=2908004 RepID=A0ABS9KKB4_9BACT|nr:GIY-YIG nuclease family protein [Terrimonas ginsenosidimutans]MCG2612760.1 GIY-YIG nuclease family protein [Terrimonas ginsenosidimutans]